ncbi:MAG: AzlD domain-containing protein [Actinomycetia bacterium]|nr:AzlD domain-containing protein [Actinomycetes bacterium]
MTLTVAVLIACALCFGTKIVGYLVPASIVEGERISRITTLLPVALLAGLIAVQTFSGDDGALVLDARLAALAVAALLLWRRANFLVVVFAGALAAALVRLAGIG